MAETKVKVRTEYHLVVLHTNPALKMDEEGNLEVMPPTGGKTGNRNIELAAQLQIWTRQEGTGAAFDSSTGFRLPNGPVRAPDAAWVRRERLADLTAEQKQKFILLCPDFVVELRPPTDSSSILQDKMREYVENGTRLGWLIDPSGRRVHVYRPGSEVERLKGASLLSGEPELPGFTLDLSKLWEPGF